VHYDVKLAKYYCWAQTARFVYVSVFVPSGYADKQLHFQVPSRPPPPAHRMCTTSGEAIVAHTHSGPGH
jgi:hypothetical protein